MSPLRFSQSANGISSNPNLDTLRCVLCLSPPSITVLSSSRDTLPTGSPLRTSRYWHTFDATDDYEFLTVSWDADVGEAGDVELVLWAEDVSTGVVSYFDTGDAVSYRKEASGIPMTTHESTTACFDVLLKHTGLRLCTSSTVDKSLPFLEIP